VSGEHVAVWNGTRMLCNRARIATTPAERRSGLLGCMSLDRGEGLLLTECSAIHTVGMRIIIDVVFVDAEGVVQCAEPNIMSNRQVFCLTACSALELPAGTIVSTETSVGDVLRFEFF
jgi:uncharacterized membrane protein (UPF0127 family)